MGYMSDVRIVTSKEGFEKLKEFVKNYLKEHQENYNLLDECDVKEEGKNQYYFGWNNIKWYENDFSDVDAIMEGLQHLKENDYSYRYMRIGEDREDYDQQDYDANRESEIYLEYPSMLREFNDQYVIDLISEQQKTIIEESKESIDYE